MPLRSFLLDLRNSGQVRVQRVFAFQAREVSDLEEALFDLDRAVRIEMPGEAPELALDSAVWGAITLYRASQFLVFRDLDAEQIERALTRPCPGSESGNPEVHYSVDLTLRHLPDLARLARGISRNDPLISNLAVLGREWPLSSVGMEDLGELNSGPVLGHPSLRQLYADRILQQRDLPRLEDPGTREALRESLGAHPELAPETVQPYLQLTDDGGDARPS